MIAEHNGFHRLLSWWSKGANESGDRQIRFVPSLQITRDRGLVSVELVLTNKSDVKVWVEEAVLVLADLHARVQTSPTIEQTRHPVRQNVRSKDTLSVSLAAAIYDGAGRPQGKYSCLVFTDVRYRVGDQWLSQTLDAHRVKMAALTVIDLRRVRDYTQSTWASTPESLRTPHCEHER